jgi:hypothetical protein
MLLVHIVPWHTLILLLPCVWGQVLAELHHMREGIQREAELRQRQDFSVLAALEQVKLCLRLIGTDPCTGQGSLTLWSLRCLAAGDDAHTTEHLG